MTLVSTAARGGGGAFNGGTITNALDVELAGTNVDLGHYQDGVGNGLLLNSGNQLEWDTSGDSLLQCGGATTFFFAGAPRGVYFLGFTAAPADGVIAAGGCALWFDQTNGAAKLMVKAKQANGTVVSAAIALA